MKVLLLLFVVPCLIAADTQCPDSNISCPDGKKCCEVDGLVSCCEDEDKISDVHILEGKMKVYPGEELLEQAEQYPNASLLIQQGVLTGTCNIFNCKGKCCKDFCCAPGSPWTCCMENRCCPPQTKCCPVGCCPKRQDCCGGGCCAENQKCCGTWCCKKKAQCGLNYNTCYGKGASFTPAFTTVLLLVASVVVIRHL